MSSVIRTIHDFPKPGIEFKDITPILLDPELCRAIVDEFVTQLDGIEIDAVAGIESRGFFFGISLAKALDVPFVPIRKQGKLPGDTIAYTYNLEYGTATIEIHSEDVPKEAKFLVHDDLLATGGTAYAAAELIKGAGAEVVAYSFLVELGFLNGREELEQVNRNVISLLSYD